MDHNRESMKSLVTISLLNFHYWLQQNGATTYVDWLELNRAVKLETNKGIRDLQIEPGNIIFSKLMSEGNYGVNFLTMNSQDEKNLS